MQAIAGRAHARPFYFPEPIQRAGIACYPLDSDLRAPSFRLRLMKARLLLVFAALTASGRAFAADEEPTKSHMKDVLKARAAEEAKKQTPAPAVAPKTAASPVTKADKTVAEPSATAAAPASPAASVTAAPVASSPTKDAPAAKPVAETPTVLPKVEVRKGRVTELDLQIAQQEKEIAREKKNTKQTETDKALNNEKVSKALAIFGGESASHRSAVAQERVSLMEEEKDILEQMKQAKTKEEKAALQKQLDELRVVRRELEKSLR